MLIQKFLGKTPNAQKTFMKIDQKVIYYLTKQEIPMVASRGCRITDDIS